MFYTYTVHTIDTRKDEINRCIGVTVCYGAEDAEHIGKQIEKFNK